MTEQEIEQAGAVLAQAMLTRTSVARLQPGPTAAEAGAIRDRFVARVQAITGERIAGYKVSGSVAADAASYGVLLSGRILASGSVIEMSRLFAPLVEHELLFIVTQDLPPDPTPAQVIAACDVAACLDVADSRYSEWQPVLALNGQGWQPAPADLRADNCFAGLLVAGNARNSAAALDLNAIDGAISVNGIGSAGGRIAAAVGDPVQVVIWLARQLALQGTNLRAGMLIASGASARPPVARAGDVMEAVLTGAGRVAVQFVE